MKNLNRFFVLFLLASLILTSVRAVSAGYSMGLSNPLAPDEMNYHDFIETEAVLLALDGHSTYVTLERIGESIDYRTNPSNPISYPIYALRISANTPATSGDRHDRNAILFDCACHAREWFTTESCLELADYLVHHRTDTASGVPELLSYADVWIIPMVNPAGRTIDDQSGGDPTQFFTDPLWDGRGWRNNADTRLCNMGANPARNFSRGFNDSEAEVYCTSQYRGFAPFSTSEANALRQFVNNHMISFAVTAHTNGQLIWNQWDAGDDAGERMSNGAAKTWLDGGGWSIANQVYYSLTVGSVGGGNGQFSAWLADPSARSGNEIDDFVSPYAFPGDLPLAGDFDSDGQADDVAVFRTANDVGDQFYWYYDYNHDGSSNYTSPSSWGQAGDRPFVGDFDSDGEMDDVAVFHTSDFSWEFDYNHNATTDRSCYPYGAACILPLTLDYDEDGFVDETAAFCPGDKKWYIDTDHDCKLNESIVGPWGLEGDLPFAGDFDRDGKVDDFGVYRPSTHMWYYNLNHEGDATDHASGPWGTADGLPIAGNFNVSDDSPDRLDDVGLFIPSSHLWQYDYFHNATFPQIDDGTKRAIQTIYLELPVKDYIYPTSMYIQAPGDGSNGFHPSANAVANMIDDAFVPMALYLIRQARAPGCPTDSSGAAEAAYCPTKDAGLVGAKIIPMWASDDSPGVLRSLQAERTGWASVTPAREQLDWGDYRMIYRMQNFATSAATYVVSMTVKRWECAATGACISSTVLTTSHTHTLAGRAAISDDFSMSLTQAAMQQNDYGDSKGDHYEIILDVAPNGGGDDDFTNNDTKVFKFQVVPRLYFPFLRR